MSKINSIRKCATCGTCDKLLVDLLSKMKRMPAQQEQMRESIADVLLSTGDFTKIEQAYRFSGLTALGSQRESNIYCEMHPAHAHDRTGRYVVIVHSDASMTKKQIMQKLHEASQQGIYTVHVLYRYVNSRLDPSTQGPLFRRFVLDEERAEEPVAYRHKATYSRGSLKHYSSERKNNFRRTRRIEREFIPPISGGTVLYYQPESKQLPKALKRYNWGDIERRGPGAFGQYREATAVNEQEPILVEEFQFFTLTPILRFSYNPKFLVGDMIGIPQIPAKTLDEKVVRRNLGLVEHMANFGLSDRVEQMAERLSIQLEMSPEDPPFVACLDNLLQQRRAEQPATVIQAETSSRVKVIEVPSGTEPGKLHKVVEMRDSRTGEVNYNCSCIGFMYRKRCGHIDEIIEGQNA